MKKISNHQVSYLIDSFMALYGANPNYFKYIRETPRESLIGCWVDTIGHYPWRIIQKAFQNLKIPYSKYSVFPPTLNEFNLECFKIVGIQNLDSAKENFLKTYRKICDSVSKEISEIESYNQQEKNFWSKFENRDPNFKFYNPSELYDKYESVYKIEYKDPYLKYLLNKYDVISLQKDFDDIYRKNLRDYISENIE